MGIAQEIDKFYYEPHNDAKCHKQGYERFGKYLCAVTYPTYLRYLKAEIPDEYKLPERFIITIRRMILEDAGCPFSFPPDEFDQKAY